MENLLITGKPGTGKTTLIKKLIPVIPSSGGFYTEEILADNRRIGFKIITLEGRWGILARKGVKSTYMLGKYGVEIKDLEELGVAEIESSLISKKIIVIDEIGKMELFSEKFRRVVVKVLDSNKTVLGVLQASNIPFLNQIRRRDDLTIFTVTRQNRENIFPLIKEKIKISFNR